MVHTRNEKITTKARRLKKGRDDDRDSDAESIGSEDTTVPKRSRILITNRPRRKITKRVVR